MLLHGKGYALEVHIVEGLYYQSGKKIDINALQLVSIELVRFAIDLYFAKMYTVKYQVQLKQWE